ncbi:hypothetical protein D3C76_1705230 [compost metagenome]
MAVETANTPVASDGGSNVIVVEATTRGKETEPSPVANPSAITIPLPSLPLVPRKSVILSLLIGQWNRRYRAHPR